MLYKLIGCYSQVTRNIFSITFSTARRHMKLCVWFGAAHFQKDYSKLEGVQRTARQIVRGLENMTKEERLEDMGLNI